MGLRSPLTFAVCAGVLTAAAASGAPGTTQPVVGRGPSLRIVPCLPDPDHTLLA